MVNLGFKIKTTDYLHSQSRTKSPFENYTPSRHVSRLPANPFAEPEPAPRTHQPIQDSESDATDFCHYGNIDWRGGASHSGFDGDLDLLERPRIATPQAANNDWPRMQFQEGPNDKGDQDRARYDAIRKKYRFDGDPVSPMPADLIKGILPAIGNGLIIGQSGAGKTFVTIDLGAALAAKGQFFGRSVRERVGVVIIAAEGSGRFDRRIDACKWHRGITGKIPLSHLPFSGNLNDDKEFEQLIEELPYVDKIFRKEHGVRLGLVVLDTTIGTFSIQDGNSSSDVTAVCKRIKQIGEKVQAFALGVHHIGKDETKGAAGSHAWKANVDVMFSAIATGDVARGIVNRREFCVAKYRDGVEGPISDYDLPIVELGEDEDGDPITSCIIQPIEAAKKQSRKQEKGPTKAEKAFAKAFDECVTASPVEHRNSEGAGVVAVDADKLKPAFIRLYEGKAGAANRARGRAWDKLCTNGAYATEKTSEALLIWRVSQ